MESSGDWFRDSWTLAHCPKVGVCNGDCEAVPEEAAGEEPLVIGPGQFGELFDQVVAAVQWAVLVADSMGWHSLGCW